MGNNLVLNLENISKSFSGVHALKNIDFQLQKGEIRALVGENGAGKSTLIKIISGLYKPDSGIIHVDGQSFQSMTTDLSLSLGIKVIYQELSLFEEMTVAENIFIGNFPEGSFKGWISKVQLGQKTRTLLHRLGLHIDPNLPARMLSVAQKQSLMIAKALSSDVKVLIMDEPTTALTNNEIDHLFEVVRKLAQEGVSVIYISHRMDEIFQLADQVTVFRDGENVGTIAVDGGDPDTLYSLMIGRKMSELYPPKTNQVTSEVVLDVKNASKKGYFDDVSFQVKNGEVLGIYGLMGSGCEEIGKTLFGYLDLDSGSINVRNHRVQAPKQAIGFGMGYVPGDRKTEGLLLNQSTGFNVILANLDQYQKYGFLDARRQKSTFHRWREQLNIESYSDKQLSENLSGGNQQKLVIAKWLDKGTDLNVLVEPTRGVDIGAKAEIYKTLHQIGEKNTTNVVISPDLPELLGICDRILVMNKGTFAAEYHREDFDEKKIMEKAMSNAGQIPAGSSESLATPVSRKKRIDNVHILSLLLVVFFGIFSFSIPGFFSASNIVGILTTTAILGTIAIGVTIALITGAIDFSIASTVAISGVTTAMLLNKGLPIVPVIFIVMFVALLIGVVNGVLVGRLGINAFIATLGTMGIIRGATYLVTGSSKSIFIASTSFHSISTSKWLVIPVSFIVMLFFYAIGSRFLSATKVGKTLFAVGGNSSASEQAGIRNKNYILLGYIISAMMASLGGMLLASRVQTGIPSVAQGWEFDIFTAVILGGTSLWGGIGRVWGTLISVILLQMLWNGFSFLEVSSFYQLVIRGILLIGAIALDTLTTTRREGKKLNPYD